MSAPIPLEDLFTDVIGKAQRGLKLTDEALAEAANLTVPDVKEAKGGALNEEHLAKLAKALGLDAAALVAMARSAWLPHPVELEGLAQFNTPFDDMTVNSYLVWDPSTRLAAAFDSGATCTPMLSFIKSRGLQLEFVFLTHTHPDHIADVDKLRVETGNPALFYNEREPWKNGHAFSTEAATAWELSALKIEPRLTWGHSRGGTSYVVTGLKQPVVVVGDALFASSMGGGMISYPDALRTNREQLFSLPDSTVVAPGHGPLSTIGEEKAHNPFYPEFK
jgi:hydroxyacylglutathione hydrolase